MRPRVFGFVLLFSACGGGEDGGGGGGVCGGVDCGHGECVDDGATAFCFCDAGYVAVGLSCLGEDSVPEPLLLDGRVVLSAGASGEPPFIAAFFVSYDPRIDGFSTPGSRATCGAVAHGDCDVVRCQYQDDPDLVFDPSEYLSAGDMTLTYGSTTVPLAYSGMDYSPSGGPFPAPEGGDAVETHASGDVVPAFDLAATVPSPVTIDAPAAAIRAGDPIAFSWSGGVEGVLRVERQLTEEDGGALLVRCAFPAAEGAGEIPGEVTSLLPRGPFEVGLAIESVESGEAGDWSVALVVGGEETPADARWTVDVQD